MEFKHTKGPWFVSDYASLKDHLEVYHTDSAKGAASHVIAKVTCRESWRKEQEANALLIAYAPDMAEALLWVLNNPGAHLENIRRVVQPILAKATGETP